MTDTQKQIRVWAWKQKQMIQNESSQKQQAYLIMLCQGYFTGLRMTNAINHKEYRELFDEFNNFAKCIGLIRKEESDEKI